MLSRGSTWVLVGVVAIAAGACGKPITARDARARAHPESDLSSSPIPGRSTPPGVAASVPLGALAVDAATLPEPRRQIVESALAMAGAEARGLDCSKLAQQLYASAGETLPRTVASQLASGSPVDLEHLRPGDLVFFAFEQQPADHVGIFTGRGAFVHVSKSARAVRVESLSKRVFAQAHVANRRFLE